MNGFKVNENKRIWKIVKLMTAEIKKKENWNFEFWMLCAVYLFFSFTAHKNIRFLFSLFCVVFGLWCEFFAGNIVLGAPLNLFSLVAVHHHLVTYLPCYSNRVGSSVRIFENLFWWKWRYYSCWYYWENKKAA